MGAESDELRERAQILFREPPLYNIERSLWTAEDPHTECIGIGDVEEEAFGNLVSAVEQYEREGSDGPGYAKLPGRTVKRDWNTDRSSVFDRILDLF